MTTCPKCGSTARPMPDRDPEHGWIDQTCPACSWVVRRTFGVVVSPADRTRALAATNGYRLGKPGPRDLTHW